MNCTKPGRYINGLPGLSIGMLKGIKHCHFEWACPLSLPAEHGICHFERSPKGEVEKSDHRQGKTGKNIAQDCEQISPRAALSRDDMRGAALSRDDMRG